MLQGDACLQAVELPPLEGFRNSCQDFMCSWSIFRAVGKILYSLEDPSSPMIHISVPHTALTCAKPWISLGSLFSTAEGLWGCKIKTIFKGLSHYFVDLLIALHKWYTSPALLLLAVRGYSHSRHLLPNFAHPLHPYAVKTNHQDVPGFRQRKHSTWSCSDHAGEGSCSNNLRTMRRAAGANRVK